jgi:hypothetical protein
MGRRIVDLHPEAIVDGRLLENAREVEIRALRRQVAEAAIEHGGYPLG